MQPEHAISGAYVDTPARAERLQLLLHLVRNAGEVIYVRAPAGAGKTRFARRLQDMLGEETVTVWLCAGSDLDIPAATADQLGLAPEDAEPWPAAALTAVEGQDLLVIVDDADRLDLRAVEALASLHARGGRLLLLGHGGLAQTTGEWDVQFVDIPPLTVEQTSDFLRVQAGQDAGRITDDLAAALHSATHGLPGPLLDALEDVLARAVRRPAVKRPAAAPSKAPGRPVWQWFAGGAGLVVLAAVLVFQDRINTVFAPVEVPGDEVARRDEAVRAITVPMIEGNAPVARGAPLGENEPPVDSPVDLPPASPPEIALPEVTGIAVGGDSAPDTAALSVDIPPVSLDGPADTPVEADDPAAPDPRTVEMVSEVEAVSEGANAPVDSAGPAADEAAPATASSTAEIGTVPAADPLDAVMQDALSMADASKAPTARRPVTRKAVEDPAGKPVDAPAAADAGLPAPITAADPVPEGAPVVTTGLGSRDPAAPAKAALPGSPAPVEDRSSPPARIAAAKAASVPPVEVTEAPPPRKAPPSGGSAWLQSRVPGHYTLQLVGARDRDAIGKFVRLHGIEQPYAIFERPLDGRPWYSLVAGDYPDRDAAIAARGRLPKRLERAGVWPRTFESIQKSQ